MPTLQIIAPSGYPQDQNAVARAVDYFTVRGWHVCGQGAALRHFQRFAGTDAERLTEINNLQRFSYHIEEKPKLVMAVRGGYGISRLLDSIDFEGLAKADLHFIGHSDFSAFNLAYYAKTGKPSYLGPMACFDFGSETLSPFMESHFWRLLEDGEDVISVSDPQPYEFKTRGVLWGGNMTMVSQLIGTPFLPKVDRGILFLEDINEHPYCIERNMYQLREAGILEQQSAIILGQFNGYKLYENDQGYDFSQMVEHMRGRCKVPILTGFPFGHVRDKVTLPIGNIAHLSVSSMDGYSLSVKAI